MNCKFCEKQLKGGFGIGSEPYKEFRCASCVIVQLANDERDRAVAEANYYLEALRDLWSICMPSRQGHYKRGLGVIVLDHVAYAASYRDRQMVVVESSKSSSSD